MLKLDQAPEVISMALALRLEPRNGAVKEIIEFCRKRIDGFIARAGRVTTLAELQACICKHLRLVFEEVWNEDDLVCITKKYVGMGEAVFASLRMQLEGDTFGTLMKREHAPANAPDLYVAVIDCRGDKGARRYFTRWHEIAHLLTLFRQLELPFHRSQGTSHDPLERLMDTIAGEIGFYGPLFQPALEAELQQTGALTFDGVRRVRDQVCPEASFYSALIACVNRTPSPLVLLEAKMALKRAEASELRSGQLGMFPDSKPKPKLRAVGSTQNSAARKAGFIIHKNMAVPPESIVAKHFEDTDLIDSAAPVSGQEELSSWRHSKGDPVGYGPIKVEAKRIGGTLFALVRPANAA